MDKLKQTLKAYNLTEKQINVFFKFYQIAKEKKIPYPYYYALSKLFI
jgi:hypothetical protein